MLSHRYLLGGKVLELGEEKNLLSSLPKTFRNLKEREISKTENSVAISKAFGQEYFDGSREFGYGGYYYDGRWLTVAMKICEEYSLKAGMKVLDVGCAKGFLVKDLMSACPGLEVFGLDISKYALMHAEIETVGRLHLGDALYLPFPDDSFDLVISINTLHNLERDGIVRALKEIQRVSKSYSYVVVDSYENQEEKNLFLSWVLTAKFHDSPSGWIELFREAEYDGDYSWTILKKVD